MIYEYISKPAYQIMIYIFAREGLNSEYLNVIIR